jgi:hypothetical protein
MADPICRWRNPSVKQVLEFSSVLPIAKMRKDEARTLVEKRWSLLGNSAFFTTAYQLASELGLYYEDDEYFYPRFSSPITIEQANDYLQMWGRKYFAPNPYTKSMNYEQQPTIINNFLANWVVTHETNPKFTEALKEMFVDTLGNTDILANMINNFSDVSIEDDILSIKGNLSADKPLELHVDINPRDKKAFFEFFGIAQYDVVDKTVPVTSTKSIQRIYYGAPGTGKSHAIKDETKGEKTIRITFHPDTDYASFVGAYKPTMKKVDVQVVPVVLSTGASFEQNKGTFSEERISYEYVMQAFLQAYVAAWEYQQDENPKPVYLIIEEINRGNCAQIFGDIFQLLDRNDNGFSDYPINADQDLQTHLCKKLSAINIANEDSINSLFESEKSIVDDIKSGKVLVLPNNLYIWATMNTSDQSLFPIDSAFKRRWDWNYVPILDAHKGWKINVRGTNYDWWDFLTRINDSIGSTTQSEDKKLGYFFCKTVNGVISAETFVSKVIFYLWNDVFKDFGLGDPLFKDDDGKELSFNKFYMVDERGKAIVNADKVALFLNNLGVKQIGSEFGNTEQDEDNAMSPEDGGSSSDYSKYSVNGSGRYGKCAAPFEAVKAYCNAHPSMTDSQIVDAWLALDVKMPNLIETEAQYKERVQGSKDSKLSTKSKTLKLNNGSTIYVSNQFNPERISDFVTKVNSSDLGIRLAKID